MSEQEIDERNISEFRRMRDELYAAFPDAAFGPGHVCLDDENWDFYDMAIRVCHVVMLQRACAALELDMNRMPFYGETFRALDFAEGSDFYPQASLEELAATLTVLNFVKWGMEGFKPEEPPQ